MKYSTMVKDNTLLFKVIDLIREAISPFTQNKGSSLVNIATGKVASQETAIFAKFSAVLSTKKIEIRS